MRKFNLKKNTEITAVQLSEGNFTEVHQLLIDNMQDLSSISVESLRHRVFYGRDNRPLRFNGVYDNMIEAGITITKLQGSVIKIHLSDWIVLSKAKDSFIYISIRSPLEFNNLYTINI